MQIDSEVLKKALRLNKQSLESMRDTFRRIGRLEQAVEQNGMALGIDRALEVIDNLEKRGGQ